MPSNLGPFRVIWAQDKVSWRVKNVWIQNHSCVKKNHSTNRLNLPGTRVGWELGARGLRPVGIRDSVPEEGLFQQSPEEL